ncbi:MAG: hypothetical protein PHZ11_02515 [Desulfitobacteriaceae bacterium]|nr:hypothetical protein [Desulfitobacteriaceae bacterium]MDD4345768.1 hypothetical protein [Desulfitobacteriaceae bacterium]MDD4400973.1 hypothetical protein [Desulfitobacteriaceae bacterium]
MAREDKEPLECLEEVYRVLEKTLLHIQKNRSIHVKKLETWAEDLRSQRRVFEDITLPARLIVEYLIELQYKTGQAALETEHLRLSSSNVCTVKVEEFGIIKVVLGNLEVSWRDCDYYYYFYPDKAELRAIDERFSIRLFFSSDFSKHVSARLTELSEMPNVKYIHPQIEQW